ncbi:MAG TPA: mycothiol system anti-sigma-R factor [Segeticoccus sp.]|jgi:mycothiol system anti-sigma-R factor|nr:mycothiol system anti-sigma-R factor [Segeticoccus sp.]
MSCGGSAHGAAGSHGDGTDCDEVVLKIYEYLDGEMGPGDCARIRQHLQECAPCMDEYERDQVLKALIRRSCACEPAPVALRTQILARITSVTVTQRTVRPED